MEFSKDLKATLVEYPNLKHVYFHENGTHTFQEKEGLKKVSRTEILNSADAAETETAAETKAATKKAK
jgi:hypothetical protein